MRTPTLTQTKTVPACTEHRMAYINHQWVPMEAVQTEGLEFREAVCSTCESVAWTVFQLQYPHLNFASSQC